VSEAESAILIALLCPRRKGYRNSSVRLSHGAAALGAQLPWAIGTIARRGVRTSHPSADGRTGWAKNGALSPSFSSLLAKRTICTKQPRSCL